MPSNDQARVERLSDELGFTRTPSEDDPRRDPQLLHAIEKIAPGTPLRQAIKAGLEEGSLDAERSEGEA